MWEPEPNGWRLLRVGHRDGGSDDDPEVDRRVIWLVRHNELRVLPV